VLGDDLLGANDGLNVYKGHRVLVPNDLEDIGLEDFRNSIRY
jgi:hypothetical protein